MHMRYYTDTPPETTQHFADIGKNFAINVAKRYNWDSWINIQTELDPIDRPTTKGQK